MDVVTFTFEESETAWSSDIDGDFAPVVSKRIDLGAGRLAKISPITGYKMRRPVQWADSVRAYSHDLHLATWEKDIGPLDGWDIAGEHDERVNETLLAGRFTCARTWANGPNGAFIAMSVTRADPDNILSSRTTCASRTSCRPSCSARRRTSSVRRRCSIRRTTPGRRPSRRPSARAQHPRQQRAAAQRQQPRGRSVERRDLRGLHR
jgi:hypothetical protein